MEADDLLELGGKSSCFLKNRCSWSGAVAVIGAFELGWLAVGIADDLFRNEMDESFFVSEFVTASFALLLICSLVYGAVAQKPLFMVPHMIVQLLLAAYLGYAMIYYTVTYVSILNGPPPQNNNNAFLINENGIPIGTPPPPLPTNRTTHFGIGWSNMYYRPGNDPSPDTFRILNGLVLSSAIFLANLVILAVCVCAFCRIHAENLRREFESPAVVMDSASAVVLTNAGSSQQHGAPSKHVSETDGEKSSAEKEALKQHQAAHSREYETFWDIFKQ